MNFLYSLQSEWLKTKRSTASWLCLIGGAFIPLIFLAGFIKDQRSINAYTSPDIWKKYFFQIWQFMSLAILPIGVVLASTLITQVEYKNNTWKQLHATPQRFSVIFMAKLGIILLMTLKFFLYFNIGILLSAVIPSLLFDHRFPRQAIPVAFFLAENGKLFITCLPVIALQYLVSLQSRNFLVPIGVGIMGLVGSLILIQTWQYAYLSPYSYTPLQIVGGKAIREKINIPLLSVSYFAGITLLCYYLYMNKKEKG